MHTRIGRAVLAGLVVLVSSCATVEKRQPPSPAVEEAATIPAAVTGVADKDKPAVMPAAEAPPEPPAAVTVSKGAMEEGTMATAPSGEPEPAESGAAPSGNDMMTGDDMTMAPDEATEQATTAPAVPENIPPNTFIITAVTKDPSHLYYGVGSNLGFAANGIQGKELVVVRGETYTFKVDTNVQHDFYLSTSPRGRGAGTLANGVKGNFTYKGIVTFKPDKSTPDVVYYECRNHKNMGSKIHVVNKGEEDNVVFGVRDLDGPLEDGRDVPTISKSRQAEQKVKFAEMFIAMSPAAKRIEDSDNTEAKGLLGKARNLLDQGKDALANGDNDEAIAVVDDALRQMSSASQLVPSEKELAEMKAQYNELLQGAQTYEKSYSRNYTMMSKKGRKNLPDLDTDAVSASIDQAMKLATDGQYFQANKILTEVQSRITSALGELLADQTMDYTLTFDTPKDRYEYELARYKSYEELIPIAIDQKKPSQQSRALMDQFVEKARSIYDQSGPTAEKGDYKTAIQMLEGATSHLQRALRVVGVR